MYINGSSPGKDDNIPILVKKARKCTIVLEMFSSKTSSEYDYFEHILVQNPSSPMVLESCISGPSFHFENSFFKAEVIQLLHVLI